MPHLEVDLDAGPAEPATRSWTETAEPSPCTQRQRSIRSLASFRDLTGRYLFTRLLLATAVGNVLAMVPFLCFYIEYSKELRVWDGFIADPKGQPVATREYSSYGILFDLPSFSLRSLAAVKQINLQLSGTKEGVFTVAGVVKHKVCKAVTFYLQDGGELLVDGRAVAAVATIRGKRYEFTSPGRRASASSSQSHSPRLYAAGEFFGVAENGSSRPEWRRLAESMDAGGWASLGVAAGQALLDDCSLEAVPHQTVSFTCEVSAGESAADMHVFYNRSDPRESAFRFVHPNRASVLVDYGVGMEFHFDPEGELTECEPMQDAQLQLNTDDLELLETNAVAGAKMIVSGVDAEDGMAFLVQVDDYFLDERSQPLQRPSVEECHHIRRPEPAGDDRPGSAVNARSLGQQLPPGYCLWWAMAKVAYKSVCASEPECDLVHRDGWTIYESCQVGNAFAHVFKNGHQLAVAIRGTEKSSLLAFLADMASSINIHPQDGFHGGFLNYAEDLKGCVEGIISQTQGRVLFYLGHSLGGAAATILYDLMKNSNINDPDVKVITYGAPKTHESWQSDCDVPGWRFANDGDPVPSNFKNYMKRYHHVIENSLIYRDHNRRRRRASMWKPWTWVRRRRQWRWADDGCEQTSYSYVQKSDAQIYNFLYMHGISGYGEWGDCS